MAATVRIGTCSWADEALSKWFYPPKLPAKERLAWYAGHFDTVEVDSTFYRLPSESMVHGWAERTPDDFTMHIKAERLDVHREAVGCSLGPALHHRLARQPVEGRVDLDRVEILGVPGEPFLRGQLRRVEPLRERLVGPRARADPDRRGHAVDATSRRCA